MATSTDNHPRQERVAEIRVASVPKGSGYLMDSRHVLTAAHVVQAQERVDVRFCKETKLWPATVQWQGRGVDGQGPDDVALLVLDEPASGRGPDPEWASHGVSDLPCEAVGYPKFRDDWQTKQPDVERFLGVLEPCAGVEHGRLNAKYRDQARPNNDWGGISGSALFVHGLFVGIVTHAHTDRLLAWPAARLVEDGAIARAWGRRRLPLRTDHLWPTEDQPLLRAIRRWEARVPPDARQPAKLLEASYEVVPFTGREAEFALLRRFVEAPGRDGALVIVGEGGAGKTRLMLEWCRRMRTQGWLAGFLKPEIDLPDDLSPIVQARTSSALVLDYAGAEPGTIKKLFRAMLGRHRGATMRVVLLARSEGPWLRDLREDDSAVEDCLDAHEVHHLGPLYDSAKARAQGYGAARARFRELASGADPVESSHAPLGDAPVDDELGQRALYVHIQGLLEASGDEDAIQRRLSPAKSLERVLQHEYRFWKRRLELDDDAANKVLLAGAKRAAAALVLCGAVPSVDAAKGLFEAVTPGLDTSRRQAILDCFAEIYEGDTGGITPIEPGLLGEKLLAQTIESSIADEEGLGGWLALPFSSLAYSGSVTRALIVLTRLANRGVGRQWIQALLRRRGVELVEMVRSSANKGKADPPGTVLEEAVRYVGDIDVAEAIGDAVPEDAVELREVEATVYGIALALAQAESETPSYRLARLLMRRGRSLSNLGRGEEAIGVTQEAVEIFRELTKGRPELFLPDLASALNNLGADLSERGRREDALGVTQEAVDIRRELAKEHPDAFLSGFASALSNLGMVLSGLGRRKDALGVTQESVDTYRELANERPDAFLPDLAGVLNNLGMMLIDLNRQEEALGVTKEAVETYRELAKKRPDAFMLELARSISLLGIVHEGIEAHEEAMNLFVEALRLLFPRCDNLPRAFSYLIVVIARGVRRVSNKEGIVIPSDAESILKQLELLH